VKRIIGDDEYVVVHSHVRQNPNELGVVVVHIYKFDNGRIEELWEVGQPRDVLNF
jgi:predicted SnoaL-like aldol condensation-catalyzing enzyme